jgi:pyruvate/oxaloacetate carboxyltransferase
MAKFSPVFTIDVTDDFAATDVSTITNPGQAFELIGVIASGTATAVMTVRKNTAGGATAAVATVIAAGSSCQLTDANTSFAATDNIHLTATTEAVTRVTLLCRALTANSPTWTNTTPA